MLQIKLSPEVAGHQTALQAFLMRGNHIRVGETFVWRKRSIDARSRNIVINAQLEIYEPGEAIPQPIFWADQDVHNGPELVIIGSGPAGLFAALEAITQGWKPLVLERGKDVRARRRDLAALNKDLVVNPESNYCFGEGGAGTYSDGKLYTRSKKRGDVTKVLQWLVHFGAPEDILVDAHPHIGTNKLPKVITAIRETIERCGGQVRFDAKVTDIFVSNGQITGLEINGLEQLHTNHVILATGHSARDIFYLIHNKGWALHAKPFALGVRVEHQQAFIDALQYHGRLSDDYLPPASYALVTQIENTGVFSFCMCPGGIIAPCATAPGEVVTNGWSPSKRNNPYANSGIVVAVAPQELPGDPNDPLIGLKFQQAVEQTCFAAAGSTHQAPAQCLKDFVEGKVSSQFPRSSYQPGIVSVPLHQILPDFIARKLRKAFKDFDKKMPGFLTNDAVVHAPESRTSAPVQIPRHPETLQHPDVSGLYPCGEGAGFAGGIVSAAIDGMKCALAIAQGQKKVL